MLRWNEMQKKKKKKSKSQKNLERTGKESWICNENRQFQSKNKRRKTHRMTRKAGRDVVSSVGLRPPTGLTRKVEDISSFNWIRRLPFQFSIPLRRRAVLFTRAESLKPTRGLGREAIYNYSHLAARVNSLNLSTSQQPVEIEIGTRWTVRHTEMLIRVAATFFPIVRERWYHHQVTSSLTILNYFNAIIHAWMVFTLFQVDPNEWCRIVNK